MLEAKHYCFFLEGSPLWGWFKGEYLFLLVFFWRGPLSGVGLKGNNCFCLSVFGGFFFLGLV